MKKVFILLLAFVSSVVNGQFLTPYQGTQIQPKVQFDYWVYSTHAGNGSVTQYPGNAGSKDDMDKIFNTNYSNTTLRSTGRTNSTRIIDWQNSTELSEIGITPPNNGVYFAIKVQGNFIPEVSGTYTFTLESDDASDLYINGNAIISTYSGQAVPALGTRKGTINVTAGQKYFFEARMQQGGGGYGMRMYWKSPAQSGSIATGYTSNWAQNVQELISSPQMDGSSAAKAAPNAKYIQTAFSNTTDGVYWINLPVVGPTQIYCILNSAVDGGGWMMMMKATTGTTFQYSSAHWTTISVLNQTDNTRNNNADAKFNTMNYYAAKDFMALWPDIQTAGGSMSLTAYGCWSWLQNNFNNGVRITPVNFFSTVDRLFLGDANNYSGKGNQFSTQTDVRFYGFNYQNTAFASSTSTLRLWTRWGFGYNENGGGLFPTGNEGSSDISGGIGVSSDRVSNYSAGDFISCCQTVRGIERQARVEVYIR